MRKKIVYGLCGLFMVLALSFPIGALAAEDVITLGAVDAYSGNFKDIGDRYLIGIQYAVNIINKSGGLLGKKVVVVPIDSELKADVTTRKGETAVLKDGINFFSGGCGSAVAAAMIQVAERNNALFFSIGQDAAGLTKAKCSRNFFRAGGNTDQRVYSIAQWIAKKGYKRVAYIAQDYSFGYEVSAAFKKKLAELSPDTKIVAESYHPTGTKDYAPYISTLINAKPDVIFTPNWGNDLMLLLKQGRPMGLNQRVFSFYLPDEVLISSLGDDKMVLGDMGTEVYVPTIPTKKNQKFVAKFKKDTGHYPSWLSGKSYIATMFWAEAIKKAGTTDVNAVIKAWEGLSYDGPAGVWTMRACDHQASLPFWGFEIVKKNPFYKHAFAGPATMIRAEDVDTPCEETGCKMKK